MKICFFCRIDDVSALTRVGFYADDIRILRDLGHDVTIATKYGDIPNDVDLIYAWWWTWAFLPLMKSRLLRVPLIVCGVFDYATPPRGLRMCYLDRPWWQKLLLRISLRFADANVFVSDYEYVQIPALFNVRNPVRIPCAVDVEQHKPARNAERGNFFFNVAWSGGYNMHRKCLKEIVLGFIEAAKADPDVTLEMAGKQGEHHKILADLAQNSHCANRIKFLGPVSQEEKLRKMQTCLAYIQPTRFEGFGLAIAEAMACGATVITSNNSAVTEVVGDCGLFANPESPHDIARVMNLPILRRADIDVLRKKGVERIRSLFTYENRLLLMRELLQSVAKERSPAAKGPGR